MIRFISISILVLGLIGGTAWAESDGRVQGVRIFLQQGNPDQAIQTAERLLASPKLIEEDRFELLRLVAEAEEFRAVAAHYQDVSKAIAAIKTLIKEFPQKIDEAAQIWSIAWLYWKNGADKLALAAARELNDRFHDSRQATDAWLLMARIHIDQKKLTLARTDLLQHGVRVEEGSHDQLVSRAWMAVVDYEEGIFTASHASLNTVFQADAEIIESEERLFSTYIHMLNEQDDREQALLQAGRFLKRYVKGFYVAPIRLLHADLRSAKRGENLDAVQKEYEVISLAEAETTVGKQAFMRKIMLQYREHQDYATLKAVIIALKRLANQNQLSAIESEASLYQARLWERVARGSSASSVDPAAAEQVAPEQAAMVALEGYARVSGSPFPPLAEQAVTEGKQLFIKQLEALIADEKWMQVVVFWQRFPQLRPQNFTAAQLQFGVAHALRMLMEYEQADALLKQLYAQSAGSVWGHKVMLERARLWLDRGDADGLSQVMAWLSHHEFTLYRPEMLLLAARIQLKNGDASAASLTIASVAVSDIAMEERGNYWKAQAEIAEKLSRWHVAAHAWKQFGNTDGADKKRALLEQANSLFQAKDYRQAETLYGAVNEGDRDAAWRYKFSICQINTGKWRQAVERLQLLKDDKNAGLYASLAALALAERQADLLMETHP